MSIILKNLSEDQADTYSLVLSTAGISHKPERSKLGWSIWVMDADDEFALRAIDRYIDENQIRQTGMAPPQYGEYQKTFSGLWVSILLLLLHIFAVRTDQSEYFIKVYGASAFHILSGELYRSVTALMLHADALHILGNMVGISLFATAVCSILGLGVGWFMILVAGIAGNLINALLHMDDHISIGASTSIFGAIGILSAYQFVKKFRTPGQRVNAFLPLCGGVALLGVLGSGEHSDLMAHLFGFVCGIISGILYCLFIRHTASARYQAGFIFLIACIITAAWMRML